jgi:hypothetical protein
MLDDVGLLFMVGVMKHDGFFLFFFSFFFSSFFLLFFYIFLTFETQTSLGADDPGADVTGASSRAADCSWTWFGLVCRYG